MIIRVLVVSNNIALWDYVDEPNVYTYEYVGEIDENHFYSELKKNKNNNIIQFTQMHPDFYILFNFKQVKQMNNEIKILEKEGLFGKKTLDIIKKAIGIVLKNKDLYLKIEYI